MDMQSTIDAATKPVNPTKIAIMDVAEKAIIQHGYKSMSFRDVAAEVGIKSASVHYHFPTKGDLSAAIMRRYREDFSERLVLPKKKRQAAQKSLNKFIDGFKEIIVDQDNMSLCTVLAAEKNILDEATQKELAEFYQMIVDWLSTVVSYMKKNWMTTDEAHHYACQIFASLHGASVLVQATGDTSFFEHAMAPWRELVERL